MSGAKKKKIPPLLRKGSTPLQTPKPEPVSEPEHAASAPHPKLDNIFERLQRSSAGGAGNVFDREPPQNPLAGDPQAADLGGQFRRAAVGVADGDSSESSEDEDSGGRRPGRNKADQRLAEGILRNLKRNHASALLYVRSLEFNNTRNFYESKRWARLIDQLIQQEEPFTSDAMEMAVRNLAGLVKSDEFGDLSILEQLEFAPSEEILSRDVFREVLKDARRNAKYKPKKKSSQPSAGAKKAGAGRQ